MHPAPQEVFELVKARLQRCVALFQGLHEAYSKLNQDGQMDKLVSDMYQEAEGCKAVLTYMKGTFAVQGPKIVFLCGPAYFGREFMDKQLEETLAGKIVLAVNTYPCNPDGSFDPIRVNPDQVVKIHQMHFAKIDLAHEVFVINKDRVIDEHTAHLIGYAKKQDKPVTFMESMSP